MLGVSGIKMWKLFHLLSDLTGGGAAKVFDCNDARYLMDQNRQLTEDEQVEFDLHLSECEKCVADFSFENALRAVIAPKKLESPSFGFDMRLAAKLGLDLAAVPNYLEPEPKTSPVSWLNWIAAAATVAGLLGWKLDEVIRISTGVGELIYAQAASLLAGKALIAADSYFGTFSEIGLLQGGIMMQLCLGAIVLASGIIAVGLTIKE